MIGRILGGYRIVEQVGMGGMATVYKAYDPGTDRYVAIKVLPEHYAKDATFRARFTREAKAIARLEHPAILPIHAYGEEENVAYLVMRYLETGTLKDRIAQGALSLGEASGILAQIGDALDYAHEHRILHRDVKPSNVLLDEKGNAYLMDFGIAKMVEATIDLTAGGLLGTPAYMSPEQCRGGVELTPASDQYALGIVAYEMVTGRVPFQAETPLALVYMHLNEPLPPPTVVRPDLPETIEKVILKALSKEPGHRFMNCGQMAAAFGKAVEGREALVAAPVVREPMRARRFPIWLVGLAAVLVIGGVVGGVLLLRPVWDNLAALVTPLPTAISAPADEPPIEFQQSRIVTEARAIGDPVLAAIEGHPSDYEDDFSDPESGWEVLALENGAGSGYFDGEYVLTTPYRAPEEGCFGSPLPGSLWVSDFVLEVDVQISSGLDGAAHISFRADTRDVFSPSYGVEFQSSGILNVFKNIQSTHMPLATVHLPGFVEGVNGDTNHLILIAQGPQIAVYVNGEPVWLQTDHSLEEGEFNFGVCCGMPGDGWLEVDYDNVRIWDITDLALP